MTRKELKASRVDASKKAQATRKRNLQLKANEPTSSQGRKRARALATKATSEELREVFGSDAGSAAGWSDEDGARDAGNTTRATGKTVADLSTSSPRAAPPHTAPAGTARVVSSGNTTNDNRTEAPASSPRTPPSRTPPVGTGGVVGGSNATSGRRTRCSRHPRWRRRGQQRQGNLFAPWATKLPHEAPPRRHLPRRRVQHRCPRSLRGRAL